MSQIALLPNEMFDDGTVQCKTFFLVSQTETYVVEFDYIERLGGAALGAVLSAIDGGASHVSVKTLGLIYKGRFWDDSILEIQWD